MKGFFSKLFNLYEGEERNAFLFTLLGFLWSLSINLGLKNADALFLIHVGSEYLPYVYIAAALGMMLPAFILIRVINAIEPSRIFLFVLGLAFLFYSLFFLAVMYFGELPPACWFVLRFVSFQLEAVLVTGYWTFLDQYHNMQDAKRVFVLFSSAVFLGQAVTGLIMGTGLFEFYQVLLMILFLLAATTMLTLFVKKSVHAAHDDTALDEASEFRDLPLKVFLKELFKSKFALFVMANNFFIYVMWMTTEYNYLSYFDQVFDPPAVAGIVDDEQARITLFLGKIIFAVSIVNLLFGLFFYSRLVRRFGAPALLFFSPVLLASAYCGWISIGGLAFPIMAYFVTEGSLEVVDDSNFNLLLNAMPKKIKYKVRVAIESMLEPIGVLASGILLSMTGFNNLYLGFIIVLIVLALAFLIRSKYPGAVIANLTTSAIHFERPASDWASSMDSETKKNETDALMKLFLSGEENDRLFALEAVFAFNDSSIFERLIQGRWSYTPKMQLKFIQSLSASAFKSSLRAKQLIHGWTTQNASDELLGEAYYFLASQGYVKSKELERFSSAEEPLLRAAYLITRRALMNESVLEIANQAILFDEEVERMLASQNKKEQLAALRLLGEELSHEGPYRLLPFLESPSIILRRAAMRSMAAILTPSSKAFSEPLLKIWHHSKDPEVRHDLVRAFGKLSDLSVFKKMLETATPIDSEETQLIESMLKQCGPEAIPMLSSILVNQDNPSSSRGLAASALGHLNMSILHELIPSVIDCEIKKAEFYLLHYRAYGSSQDRPELHLLGEWLSSAFNSKIEFIIRLLSSAGEIADPEAVCRLYRSKNGKIKSQVVETLEKTCARKIFRKLRPLIEEPVLESAKRNLGIGSQAVLPLEDLLNFLAQSTSLYDRIAGAAVLHAYNPPHAKEALKSLLETDSPILKNFAEELLRKL